MFSVFSQSPNHINIHQENNDVVARKRVASTRKPLADRKVSKNLNPSGAKPKETQKEKIKTPFKVVNKVDDADENLYIDTCSYKPVPDTYNDVMDSVKIDHISNILFGNMAQTPPPEYILPEIDELTEIEPLPNYDALMKMNYNFAEDLDFLEEIHDVPFPKFNF